MAAEGSLPAIARLKVLCMGDSQVGKSCLIKRYCENKFVARYISTIGVDYGVKPVALGGREVRVNFFDLAGLDVYKDIRVEFFKDCHGAALIFSLADRPSFEHLDAWWKEAQEKGCAAHAWVLVGNKSEMKRAVTFEEAQKWAEDHKMPFVEVSASTGQAVTSMFDALFAKSWEAVQAAAAAGK